MKHSINSLVPNEDAELALLSELHKCGGEGDTGYIIDQAIIHFPILQTSNERDRETPSGRPWWPGRFRFDLSNLGKKGEAVRIKRGTWRITQIGTDRLKKQYFGVKKEPTKEEMRKEVQSISEITLAEKLMELWIKNMEGSKAEVCQQISERIFSLLSLSALPETKPIFDKLWEIIDFDELYWMTGSLGVTGFWGKDTYLEPFQ